MRLLKTLIRKIKNEPAKKTKTKQKQQQQQKTTTKKRIMHEIA